MRSLLLALLVTLAASTARADQKVYGQCSSATGSLCLISGNPCSGTATYTITPDGVFAKVRVHVAYTHSTGTSNTIRAKCTRVRSGTYADFGSRSITAGASTLTPLIDTWTPNATAAIMPEWGIEGCIEFQVSFTINGCVSSSVIIGMTAFNER